MTDVWSDGSCSLRHGGWAWTEGAGARHDYGYVPDTTNQRMELYAALMAIEAHPEPVIVHSDSAYLVNCFVQDWRSRWLRRNWHTAEGKPVINRDIWERLFEEVDQRQSRFVKVKGHSGIPGNEEADRLAVLVMERGRRRLM